MLSPMAWSCNTTAIGRSESVELPLLDVSKALEAACGDVDFLVTMIRYWTDASRASKIITIAMTVLSIGFYIH